MIKYLIRYYVNTIKGVLGFSVKYFRFNKEYKIVEKEAKKDGRFIVRKKDLYPCLYDNTGQHFFDTHYIYHPAWAARILKEVNPECHVDISSTLQFSSIISAFIQTTYYDYRPANLNLSNFRSASADLSNLHFKDNSIVSLSCMHVVEHIGLGRYGDPIDVAGDLKAFSELQRVVAPNGMLLFVTPVGKPKLQFNAHRIYSYEQIMSYFNGMELQEFALIPDNAATEGLLRNANPALVKEQTYGCGCFWFKKVN